MCLYPKYGSYFSERLIIIWIVISNEEWGECKNVVQRITAVRADEKADVDDNLHEFKLLPYNEWNVRSTIVDQTIGTPRPREVNYCPTDISVVHAQRKSEFNGNDKNKSV